jgi:hypothetical protein
MDAAAVRAVGEEVASVRNSDAPLDIMPWWVRVARDPLLDRSAHAWMWTHGGWGFWPPEASTHPGRAPAFSRNVWFVQGDVAVMCRCLGCML